MPPKRKNINNNTISNTHFLVPAFDDVVENKLNQHLAIVSDHELIRSNVTGEHNSYNSAIAIDGFSAENDGTYIFAAKVINFAAHESDIGFGFSASETYHSELLGYPSIEGLSGVGLFFRDGDVCGGSNEDDKWQVRDDTFSRAVLLKTKEVISILTCSDKGECITVQFIVDGREGKIHDCPPGTFQFDDDENPGKKIFPVVTLTDPGDRVKTIPFHEVQSRSPLIAQFMKEYEASANMSGSIIPSLSASNAENDALIALLRHRQDEDQQTLIRTIRMNYEAKLLSAQTQAEMAEQELRLSAEILQTKLDLERAENQKLRNLLEQSTIERKEMELFYLKRESGQRREREKDDAVEVKKEFFEEAPSKQKKSTPAKKK
jgi:hypothetical protein